MQGKKEYAVPVPEGIDWQASGRIPAREQKIREIQKFNLFSDTFMSVALEDVGACQYVLRILVGDEGLRLCRVKSQYTISSLASHNAWLDVLAEDTQGRLYALEVQRRDTVDHPRRVRFYGSMIDSSFLLKGEGYDKLPEVRLFYIGAGDFLGSGKASAEVEKSLCVKEEQQRGSRRYEDGLRVTYINAGVEDDTEVSRLMKYFKTADPEDTGHGELSKRVRFLKKEEEGIRIMCEVTERFWQWGYESGKEEGERRGIRKGERKQAQTARNLALMGMSLETIAKAVEEEIPVVERWLQEL